MWPIGCEGLLTSSAERRIDRARVGGERRYPHTEPTLTPLRKKPAKPEFPQTTPRKRNAPRKPQGHAWKKRPIFPRPPSTPRFSTAVASWRESRNGGSSMDVEYTPSPCLPPRKAVSIMLLSCISCYFTLPDFLNFSTPHQCII